MLILIAVWFVRFVCVFFLCLCYCLCEQIDQSIQKYSSSGATTPLHKSLLYIYYWSTQLKWVRAVSDFQSVYASSEHTYWKCNWKHLIIIVGARTRHVFNVFNAIVDFQRNYNKWNLVFLKRIRQAASKICSFPYLHCGLLSATALIQRYLGHTRCWDICYPTIYPRHTNLTNVVR